MNTEIKSFTNPNGYELRTVTEDGNIYFVGKDVATMLGYTNTKVTGKGQQHFINLFLSKTA